MSSQQSYRPGADIVHTEMHNGELVLLDLKTRKYSSLNKTGARIWALMAEGKDLSGVAQALAAEYNLSAEDATASVAQLVSDLLSNELIEEIQAAS